MHYLSLSVLKLISIPHIWTCSDHHWGVLRMLRRSLSNVELLFRYKSISSCSPASLIIKGHQLLRWLRSMAAGEPCNDVLCPQQWMDLLVFGIWQGCLLTAINGHWIKTGMVILTLQMPWHFTTSQQPFWMTPSGFLLRGNPLPEPMLIYCQFDLWERNSEKFESRLTTKCIISPKSRSFCSVEASLVLQF